MGILHNPLQQRIFWQLTSLMTLVVLLSGCGINNIPTYDEKVTAAWSQVENQYQRRADLIPNLVETVKGFAAQEQETLTAVIAEDGSFKRVKFTDRLKEETDDIPKDQVEARLDAEFALMSAELSAFLDFMRTSLSLEQE